jgi:hypothetical protein
MHFYHRSFSEFLDSESRAQHLFVSEARVRKYVTESCLQRIPQQEDLWNSRASSKSFPPESLTYLPQSGSRRGVIMTLAYYFDPQTTHVDNVRLVDFTRNNGWGRIDEEVQSPEASFSEGVCRGLALFTLDAFQRLNVRTILLN